MRLLVAMAEQREEFLKVLESESACALQRMAPNPGSASMHRRP